MSKGIKTKPRIEPITKARLRPRTVGRGVRAAADSKRAAKRAVNKTAASSSSAGSMYTYNADELTNVERSIVRVTKGSVFLSGRYTAKAAKERQISKEITKQMTPKARAEAVQQAQKAMRIAEDNAQRMGAVAEKANKTYKAAQVTAKNAYGIKNRFDTARQVRTTRQAAHKAATQSKKAQDIAAAAKKAAAASNKTVSNRLKSMLKRILADLKTLVNTLVAGGSGVIGIILIICIVGGLIMSPFGVFFSGDNGEYTMRDAVREIDAEYQEAIEGIKDSSEYDYLEQTGSRASWPELLTIYSVATNTNADSPIEVATMNQDKLELLRDIFWQMTDLTSWEDVSTETTVVTETDANGNIVTSEEEYTEVTLYIHTAHLTAEQMAAELSFDDEQKSNVTMLLAAENNSLWTMLLYGASDGIVAVALSQLGNVGGEIYWNWYGYTSHVSWCACFVSWCAEQCGLLESGVYPRFSSCMAGAEWFRERGKWQDGSGSYTPQPGDLIFFDWELDGKLDHVGIVEYIEGGVVHTVEGNAGDQCRQKAYKMGSDVIIGYGLPNY